MVTNLISDFSGNAVVNQFVICEPNKVTFQSYNTRIAVIDANNNVSLSYNMWDYSRTTLKYLTMFLRQNGWHEIKCKKDIEKMISNGTFKTW